VWISLNIEFRMRDLTEKQFVVAMARNGFTKDRSLLNGVRHPALPQPMYDPAHSG
jgi:hypothetical protein